MSNSPGSNGHASATTATTRLWSSVLKQEIAARIAQPEDRLPDSEPVGAEHAKSENDESPAMSDTPSREEIKAQIEASEARGETKIARIEGKLDLVLQRLQHVDETTTKARDTTWQAAGAVIAVLGLLIAFGQWMYGSGAHLRDLVAAESRLQERERAPQTESIDEQSK